MKTSEQHIVHYLQKNEAQLLTLANKFAKSLPSNPSRYLTVYLYGDLGAGKTTFSRGLIQALGYEGKVKSPTYTLVEEYSLTQKTIYHFDLYRLSSPEELECIGIRDYFSTNSLLLVEWPEKGAGILPQADFVISIAYSDTLRNLTLEAKTPLGQTLLDHLVQNVE